MNLTIKKCTKCGESKPTIEFSKDAQKRDGLHSSCKACDTIAKAAWRTANHEKISAYAVQYRVTNREKHNASRANWRAANRARASELTTKWNAAHPEARRIHSHNRRARERESGGRLSIGLAERLFVLQRGKCACGCKQQLGDDYHLDHIMPLALGGTNTDDNIQLLRAECNHKKHAKHPIDFMRQRGFLL